MVGMRIEHLLLGNGSNLGSDRSKYILVEHMFIDDLNISTTWSLPPSELCLSEPKLVDNFKTTQFNALRKGNPLDVSRVVMVRKMFKHCLMAVSPKGTETVTSIGFSKMGPQGFHVTCNHGLTVVRTR
ncbi:hypothetical protein V6Z11_A12G051500 [Gossypium hirsutum]